ncbi:MAG: hypothetical protein ABF308_06410, partial [Phaeobacter gallaeciensis]
SSEQGKSLQQAATELAQLVAQFKPSSSSFASATTPSAHGDWDLAGQGYDDDFGQELMAG